MMSIATDMASPELVATLRARFRGVVRILEVTVEGGGLRIWPQSAS